MSKYKFLLTLLFTVIAQTMMAQSKVISGTVEDAMGPIMMANVVERDANNRIVSATQTDMMGNFSMEIKNPKNKLVFSYVGNKTKIVNIGNQTTFNIKMESENTTVSEVVVKGRRTSSGGLNIDKREISVSQQTFSMDKVDGMAFTSADEALQGEIAGLDIVSNSGNLGAGTSMRLRGVSTLSGNAEPLIVVDDKIFEYDKADFDPENIDEEAFSSLLAVSVDDIANITVLKDAAATAIWGSQGANGVIQITTKRGARGKPKVTLGYKFTGTWMPAGYDLLNGDNYTMMLKEEFYNPTQSSSATSTINEINYIPAESWAEANNWNKNTDWVGAIKQFGEQHEANFNISGGGQKATFRISGSYSHQLGTIIKQKMDRLTTRLVLDYNVSDRIRFSTNFALTYTDNLKNYTYGSSKSSGSHNNLLAMALTMAPNASIWRMDQYNNNTGEYFLMNPTVSGMTPDDGNYTSEQLSDVVAIGNPVAYANRSWQKEKTYSIVPDFNIKYELLGTGNGQTRLTFNGRVYFDIYAYSKPTYMPGSLSNGSYTDSDYNFITNTESNQFKMGSRLELIFTPAFKNEDFNLTMLARYEAGTQKNTYQYIGQNAIPNGIESATIDASLISMDNQPGTTKSAWQNAVYNAHFSYKSRYNVGFSLRADGNSKFGPKNPWFISPSVSLRYNLSEEAFFTPLRNIVSMFGIRGSWGITGSSSVSVDNYFNQYNSRAGRYGTSYYTTMSGMKLDDLRPQKKTGVNLGFNVGLLNDMFEFDLNLYKENTKDLIMQKIPIPTSATWNTSTTLSFGNVGEMENKGWELSVTANRFVKIKKFSVSASVNLAQNVNKLLEMDQRVLDNLNSQPSWGNRGSRSILSRVVVGDPLCSIYGFNSLGVFQYTYDYLTNYNTKQLQLQSQAAARGESYEWNYEAWINQQLAEGKTFPVATDEEGKVIMTNTGVPKHLTYYYGDTEYEFKGGDAIYEDVNHDGTINELDIKYLGNSLPKMQGGFSFTLQYGNWRLISRFNFRWGNKIINTARMGLESMYGTENQCSSVTYRWRKDGDVTVIPRALYGTGYNYQVSSRFVEDGSFLRFNNLQLSYSVPKNKIKKLGLNSLSAYVTMNNLFCWTKYTGIDPEIASGTYTPASDGATTPRSKSITASLSFGF
ncbi:MAG: SusC/RagA family TonB-linked outer membrane protein [Prevotella sp.]|nr:SusC/RagA family TonB-linked outer membrane protein [Prevotella sp.]